MTSKFRNIRLRKNLGLTGVDSASAADIGFEQNLGFGMGIASATDMGFGKER